MLPADRDKVVESTIRLMMGGEREIKKALWNLCEISEIN